MSFNPDIQIKIFYTLGEGVEPNKIRIETNATPEGLEEILGAWCEDQIGLGGDDSKAKELPTYEIVIQLDLTTDTFRTKSNIGNKCLTAGIVMTAFKDLSKVEISGIPEKKGFVNNFVI
jgi:hypothetical protein